jgi:hypothetical protein
VQVGGQQLRVVMFCISQNQMRIWGL